MYEEDMDIYEDDEDDEENWLASYSDLMSDLLAVFIMLYSFALLTQGLTQIAVNAKNTMALSDESSQSAGILNSGEDLFENNNNTGDGTSESQEQLTEAQRLAEELKESYERIAESIETYVLRQGLSERVDVIAAEDNTIIIRADDTLFFESGSSELGSDAYTILADISEILKEHIGNIELIRIEGHTDNQPIQTARFASNWELSVDRAVKVLRQLIQLSVIDAEKLAAVGYSEYRPIADNNTEEGRSQNRRVDFVITVSNPTN